MWLESQANDFSYTDWHILAQIHRRTGDWQRAWKFYKEALLSSVTLPAGSIQRIELVLDYVYFLVESDRDLERAEHYCTDLLKEIDSNILFYRGWRGDSTANNNGEYNFPDYSTPLSPVGYVLPMLEALSLTMNYLGRYDEALSILSIADHRYGTRLPHTGISIRVAFSRALAFSGLQSIEEANLEFCRAWITSAILLGNWHSQTLWILYAFGVALLSWGREEEAASLIAECYTGRYYRFGPQHPLTSAAFRILQRCDLSQSQNETIQLCLSFEKMGELRSIAFEHMELWTVADMLPWIEGNCYGLADNIIGALLESANLVPEQTIAFQYLSKTKLRFERSMAACKGRLGYPEDAIVRLEWLLQSQPRASTLSKLQLQLDMAIILSQRSSTASDPRIQEFCKRIFFEAKGTLERFSDSCDSIVRALHRRLTENGLAYFEFDPHSQGKTSPFTTIEKVGHGAFAVVESVEVHGSVYARKAIMLPKHKERMLRKQLENEVSIMRSLNHPHIVRIVCTYQENRQYSIVLEPLATADLESYPYQTNAKPLDLSPTIERWMRCLAGTLAYIHRQGVRHKDVKSRNILVKGDQVYFSDFGSSRTFSADSASSTEGPAYGHTRMYCAPEVIAQQRRNASSDVFSLGCVFAEMITVLCGLPLANFQTFRYVSDRASEYYGSHNFHATLDQVEEWFCNDEHMPIWGSDLYRAFVAPMLEEDSVRRPPAAQISKAMDRYFRMQGLGTETSCTKCGAYATNIMADGGHSRLAKRTSGKIKWMDPERGFGYVENEQSSSIILRYEGVRNRQNLSLLRTGQTAEFTICQTPEGPEAYDLVLTKLNSADGHLASFLLTSQDLQPRPVTVISRPFTALRDTLVGSEGKVNLLVSPHSPSTPDKRRSLQDEESLYLSTSSALSNDSDTAVNTPREGTAFVPNNSPNIPHSLFIDKISCDKPVKQEIVL